MRNSSGSTLSSSFTPAFTFRNCIYIAMFAHLKCVSDEIIKNVMYVVLFLKFIDCGRKWTLEKALTKLEEQLVLGRAHTFTVKR